MPRRRTLSPELLAEASRYSMLIRWSDADQIFIAGTPELKGARTHGATAAEAAEMVTEVAAIWLEMAREMKWEIPAPHLYPDL